MNAENELKYHMLALIGISEHFLSSMLKRDIYLALLLGSFCHTRLLLTIFGLRKATTIYPALPPILV